MSQSGKAPESAPTPEALSGLVARMSPAEKIGQLLMIGFDGQSPPPEVAGFIKQGYAGGVILFSRNIGDPVQLRQLTRTLQEVASGSKNAIPLLIGVDQEGGPVIRISKRVTVFPGNMALGAVGRSDYSYLAGKAVAVELADLGINLNFAPVLDVNNNPDNPVIGIRSFGEDPQMVAELGVAYARGLRDGGVLAVAKHFPGHGDTAVDSHLSLPLIPHDLERLDRVELKPFKAAIADRIGAIMTTHIVFPAVEPAPGIPATLSGPVLNGLLRQKLGFSGVIITDCLEMNAISGNFETSEAAAMAIKAGADLVLISHSFAKQKASHEKILAWVEKGQIPMEQIDQAVRRVLTLKLASGIRGLLEPEERPQPDSSGGCLAHQELARRIATDSLTLIRNRRGLLPLKLNSAEAVRIYSFQNNRIGVEEDHGPASLAEAMAAYHGAVSERNLEDQLSEAMKSRLKKELHAKHRGITIVATRDARRNPDQVWLIHELIAAGAPFIVIAMRTPYDLMAFPEIDTYLAAYGFRRATMEALAGLLWGELLPKGKLPVSLHGLYPAGYGMEQF